MPLTRKEALSLFKRGLTDDLTVEIIEKIWPKPKVVILPEPKEPEKETKK